MGELRDAFEEGAREEPRTAEVVTTLIVLGVVAVSLIWVLGDLFLGNDFVKSCVQQQGTAVYTETGHSCYPQGTPLR